jgi:pyrroline-5-carboxylate reductase
MKKKIIGIIGGGNMGEALIKGLTKNKLFRIYVCEANSARINALKEKYKISYEENIRSLISKVDIIILAVKPQDMDAPLSQLRNDDSKEDKLFISIAAGLTTKFFEKHLGNKARVVRAMPNMPALEGQSMTAICKGRFANSVDVKQARGILTSIGEVIIVEEKYMDAITAVSGSGPAYVFLFVEQWISAAENLGFDKTQARQLVYKTLLGSVHLLKQSDFDATELRAKVTSKGGTTEAAMKVFFKGDKFGKLMKDALLAAKKRAKELAK